MSLVKSKQRVADHGEVFTPVWMVEAMLNLVKDETDRIDSRFLESACGDGNFLVQVLRRKLAAVELKYGQSDFERRHFALLGLMCIYGIELLPDNIADCRANLLYLLMERFNEKSKVDLRPASMSNHEMGYVFEHLLRKFNEALNENPGEYFTPREVIRLMVDLVLMFDTDLASGEGVARTVNDCCCGTGGMLTITKDRIQQINPQAKVFLYGQAA